METSGILFPVHVHFIASQYTFCQSGTGRRFLCSSVPISFCGSVQDSRGPGREEMKGNRFRISYSPFGDVFHLQVWLIADDVIDEVQTRYRPWKNEQETGQERFRHYGKQTLLQNRRQILQLEIMRTRPFFSFHFQDEKSWLINLQILKERILRFHWFVPWQEEALVVSSFDKRVSRVSILWKNKRYG